MTTTGSTSTGLPIKDTQPEEFDLVILGGGTGSSVAAWTFAVTTFSDLINGEWKDNGLPGVVRVWRSAVGEVFSAAVPLQLQRSIVVATSLALLSSLTLFMAIFYAMTHVCNGE